MSLTGHALPILFTLFFWWFSTGLILYLDGLPRRTFRWSLGAASIVLVAALYALHASANDRSASGAYCAFSSALLVWGWFEMAFLMGFIVGPRRTACPPDSRGFQRARFAFEAIAYHEYALVAGAALIAAVTWRSANQLGLWTFALLWVARLSTKLNLFLGVRNLSEEFLPDHLRYLQSYFRRRPMNSLFPFSVAAGVIAGTLLWQAAFEPTVAPAEAAGVSFLATLTTLALLEHGFLVLPIKFAALWEWGLESRRASSPPSSPRRNPGRGDARARTTTIIDVDTAAAPSAPCRR